jgi:hypothetical protein
MPNPNRLNLREDVHCDSSHLDVDAEAGIVRNVKVLGLESKNGRRYEREAVKEAASKYEGCFVNVDHPAATDSAGPRPYAARFGRLKNVREDADGGLRGDVHFNPEHTFAKSFVWFAKNDPGAIGLSHNALGEVAEGEDGTLIVSKVVEVYSVDLVADPATTQGLHEAMDPLADALNPPATSLPGAEPAPGEEGYESHLGKLVAAIVMDATLTADDKKRKVLVALKLMGDNDPMGMEPVEPVPAPIPEEDAELEVDGDGDGMSSDESAPVPAASDDDEEEEDDDAKKFEESIKSLRKENKTLRARVDLFEARDAKASRLTQARAACKAAGISDRYVSDVFLDVLVEAKDASWKALIEDRRRALSGTRSPISPGPTASEITLDAFVATLTN